MILQASNIFVLDCAETRHYEAMATADMGWGAGHYGRPALSRHSHIPMRHVVHNNSTELYLL